MSIHRVCCACLLLLLLSCSVLSSTSLHIWSLKVHVHCLFLWLLLYLTLFLVSLVTTCSSSSRSSSSCYILVWFSVCGRRSGTTCPVLEGFFWCWFLFVAAAHGILPVRVSWFIIVLWWGSFNWWLLCGSCSSGRL